MQARWLLPIALSIGIATHAHVQAQDAISISGVTVGPVESSQLPGRGYGTEYSARLLDHLKSIGANWISITPFGRIAHLQGTEILMDFEAPYKDNKLNVGEMIRQAKSRGLKVLLVPHLWVEQDGWRGEIDPGSNDAWRKYKRSYSDFVLSWARVASSAGADAFSIGVECKSWSWRFEDDWRALIKSVRRAFKGKLTYSANWDEAEDVVFWESLDWIGINAFYPLADHDDATTATYREGAEKWAKRVERLSKLQRKPVLLVEIGYTTRTNAAVEPWLWPDGMQDVQIDEHEQARAYEALLSAFVGRKLIIGFFVWRYYANLDDLSQESEWGFSPHAKAAQSVLEDFFRMQNTYPSN